jgi:hypothetical protein
MKKVILIIAIILSPFISNAQKSVFDKYDGNPEVTTVVVSKKAFELMAMFGNSSEEAKEYAEMVGGLDGLKVFTTEDSDIAADMQKTVDVYLKSAKLSELMRVNDKEANVRIYIREGKDDEHVRELLMFVNGLEKHFEGVEGRSAEAVIVSLTGNIDLSKIAKLTEQMNISGSEHLKKAGN